MNMKRYYNFNMLKLQNLIVFVAALLATAYSACESGWRSHGGNCYRFTTEKQTWPESRQMCLWHKSDLVVIETAEEQTWFRKEALTFNHTDGDTGFWIGGANFNNDGNWIWEPTNKPLTYAPWGSPPQQPNNRENRELCLASMKYFDYSWSDEYCDWDVLQYVCEKKDTGTTIVG
ncbi:perlucin-like protein isoform X3 [Ruditapes philippinarum]|uniref:perlucin-like protein isoform X3 n=1 Tax=Ruditapes philippinarum TaxID=129788 RepID=UPI00295BD448|nr:perlucin-like protein isoform X3 [Ruditapes philippinarum]